MGQTASCTADISPIREEVYLYYPGLEQQLDMAFNSHDLEEEGFLPFDTLEPIVRHLLLQFGLVEYVARFAKTCGDASRLDSAIVEKDLRKFGVDIRYPLDVEMFKDFCVIWIKKILDTYNHDQAEWTDKLLTDQKKQSDEFTKAMRSFEQEYSAKQEMYSRTANEQKMQVKQWSEMLAVAEKQKNVNEELNKQGEEEKIKREREMQLQNEEESLVRLYKENLGGLNTSKMVNIPGLSRGTPNVVCYGDGTKVIQTSFLYPVTATPYGACASAGSIEPSRRRKRFAKMPKAGCCS